MISIENINYHCNVEVSVYNFNVLVKEFKHSNLLTNAGKLVMLSRLCDPSSPYSHLNKMIFGDSIYAATVLDNLDDFGPNFYLNDTKGHSLNFITEDSVEVYWELQESEYNGRWIKCVGLSSDDFVFNRVVFPEIDYTFKVPSMRIVGKWVIRLTQN